MSTLYELTEAITELGNMEEDEAVINTLEGMEMEFKDKANNIILLERNMTANIDAIDAEINRLQQRKKIRKNRIDGLKEYLRDNMERTGITKIECPLFTITCAKGRDIVLIEDSNSLPDEYIEVETVEKPKKNMILAALKDKKDVPGATLVKSKSSIRIK